eukprot:228043_1
MRRTGPTFRCTRWSRTRSHDGPDSIHLMASLVEPGTGKILVDGIMDDVDPVTEEERKLYESIEFDLEEMKESCKVKTISDKLLSDDKVSKKKNIVIPHD